MSTLLNKSYLVKVSTKGEGGQKCPKFCLRGLYTAPNMTLLKTEEIKNLGNTFTTARIESMNNVWRT